MKTLKLTTCFLSFVACFCFVSHASAAVAYRGGYNSGGAANPTSGTWSLSGTNAVAGDFAICVWYSRATTKTITPTGPTLITNQDKNTTNGGHIWVGYKVLNATDISNGYAGTWTASSVTNGTTGSIVAVFSGVDTSVGVSSYSVATPGGISDPNPPATNTTSGDALVTIFGTMDQNDGVTAPTNFSMGTDAAWSTTSGSDGSSGVAYDLDGGTGSSVDPAVFTTTTDAYWYATTLNLRTEYVPTTVLNTPANGGTVSTTTPTLNFTGTDLNSDTLEYNVQVDTVNTFKAWNVTTAVYAREFSVAAKEIGPTDVFFRADGLKMYTIGTDGATVDEYNLGTPWSVITAVYLQEFSVVAKDNGPAGVFFRADGLKMYTIGSSGDTVDEYNLGTPWSVITAVYLQEFSIAAKETYPMDVFFRADGLKMYTIGLDGATVDEYDLGAALLSKFSNVDAGFTAGHPFVSGVAIDYTVQAANALTNGITYYWRVAATDPSGSNTYGAWSPTWSFTVSTGGGGRSMFEGAINFIGSFVFQ